MYKIVIVGLLALSSLNLYSQEKEFGKNIMIESKYKTVLPKLNKLDYKPEIKDTVLIKPNFDYFLKAKRALSFYNLVENDYPKYEEKNIEEIDGAYLRLGLGNYMTFLGEFAYNNPIKEKYNWGMHINSYSAAGRVKKREIGFVEQSALFYIMKLEEEKSYGASVSYDRNLLHLYDIEEKLNKPKDRRDEFVAKMFYKNDLKTGLHYAANLDYTNFIDSKIDAVENYIDFDANAKIDLEESELILNLGLDYLSSKTDSYFASDFDFASLSLEPHFKTDLWKFKFDIGFGFSKYLGENSNFYLYPKTNIYVDLFGEILGLYAKIDGGVSNNNYLKSYKINPYAIVTESKQTFNRYTFGGGLKGSFEGLFWYNIGANYANIDNFMYYGIEYNSNWSLLTQKYEDLRLFTFNAELGVNLDENLSILSSFKTYSFNKNYILNLPNYEILINAKYKFSDKFSLGSDLYLLGERKISKMINSDIRETNRLIFDPNVITDIYDTNGLIFDLNVNAEYKFSKYIQVFASVNNIFNQNYQRWEEYPVMGISALAGITISF